MIRLAIVLCLALAACANPPPAAENSAENTRCVTLEGMAQKALDEGWSDFLPLTADQRAQAITAYNNEPGGKLPDGVDTVYVFYGDDVPSVFIFAQGRCVVAAYMNN